MQIGDHVRINSGVTFITHDGSVWVLRNMAKAGKLPEEMVKADLVAPIKVGNNVQIGSGAMIMPGVVIGDDCVIGAGSIVTHDVPSGTVVAGVPARRIETTMELYEKHKEDFDMTKNMSAQEKKAYYLSKYGADR